MQIEVAIVIDGEAVKANSDLQELLEKLVGSYIKQKFLIGKTFKTPKTPRDSSIPYAPKKHMTEEQVARILARGRELSAGTIGDAAKDIAAELNRPTITIYNRLYRLIKSGDLKFAPSTHPNQWKKSPTQ